MCVALPGRIISLHRDGVVVTGMVDFDGQEREINFTMLPDVEVGEHVVAHAGFAVARAGTEDVPGLPGS